MTTAERVKALLIEARKKRTQPWHPRFSSAGDCRRRLVYSAAEAKAGRQPEYEDRPARWNFASRAGTAVGDEIEEAAKRLGAETQVPVRIERDGLVITGTADIVWPDSVWDTKWMGDYSWWQAASGPTAEHRIQVGAYAEALGKPRYAVVCWPWKSFGRGETLQVTAQEEDTPVGAVELLVEIWKDVERHVFAQTVPERDYERAKCDRFKCRFIEQCWAGEP